MKTPKVVRTRSQTRNNPPYNTGGHKLRPQEGSRSEMAGHDVKSMAYSGQHLCSGSQSLTTSEEQPEMEAISGHPLCDMKISVPASGESIKETIQAEGYSVLTLNELRFLAEHFSIPWEAVTGSIRSGWVDDSIRRDRWDLATVVQRFLEQRFQSKSPPSYAEFRKKNGRSASWLQRYASLLIMNLDLALKAVKEKVDVTHHEDYYEDILYTAIMLRALEIKYKVDTEKFSLFNFANEKRVRSLFSESGSINSYQIQSRLDVRDAVLEIINDVNINNMACGWEFSCLTRELTTLFEVEEKDQWENRFKVNLDEVSDLRVKVEEYCEKYKSANLPIYQAAMRFKCLLDAICEAKV